MSLRTILLITVLANIIALRAGAPPEARIAMRIEGPFIVPVLTAPGEGIVFAWPRFE